MRLRRRTITNQTFTVAGAPATVSYDVATKVASLKPTANLNANTQYIATISTSAKDLAGNPLAGNFSWSFTTGPGAAFPRSIILANGAQPKNIFWQVGSAATINAGGGGTMVGTVIAQAGVTISTAGSLIVSTFNGRALGLHASVTMVNTHLNIPAP